MKLSLPRTPSLNALIVANSQPRLCAGGDYDSRSGAKNRTWNSKTHTRTIDTRSMAAPRRTRRSFSASAATGRRRRRAATWCATTESGLGSLSWTVVLHLWKSCPCRLRNSLS